VTEEYCWAITKTAGSHAALHQVPVCWSLDFTWTPFYMHVSLTIYIYTPNPDLGQNSVAPALLERESVSVPKLLCHPTTEANNCDFCDYVNLGRNNAEIYVTNNFG
jgi:hypothetical protein